MTPEETGRRYLRAVESAWAKLTGRPVVVSPREFETIDGWRRRGIPLAIVLEALKAAGSRRSGRPPRSLNALTHTVEDAFAVVAAGRIQTTVGAPVPARADIRLAWESALSRCAADFRLRALLSKLLAEEAEGKDSAALDASLDASLPGAVTEAQLAQASEETRNRLAEFRARMSDEEFRATFDRARIERLRLMLALPRASLTR